MKPWKRVEPTTVTKVGWRTVVTKSFVQPDGSLRTYDTFHPEGTRFVSVIALTNDNRVVVGRQFRPGPELMMDELPGGWVDPHEDPLGAARRELREETGYEPGGMEFIGVFCRDAYFNATSYYYVATNCRRTSDQQLDDSEHVDVHLITIDELIDNAKHNRMTDPAAVLYAYEKLRALAKK